MPIEKKSFPVAHKAATINLNKPTQGGENFGGGDLKVEYVPINTVKRWKDNPKSPEVMERNAKALIPLLRRHKFKSPLVCWRKDRVVYKGNTTHLGCEMAGVKMVPVLFVDFPSQAAANAYAISDNNAGARSEYDDAILQRLMMEDHMKEYAGSEKDMSLAMGFTEKQLKTILHHTGDALPDAMPDVDVQGLMPGKVDYLFLQFNTKEELDDFKNRLGIKDPRGRVIPFVKVLEIMEFKLGSDVKVTPVKSHLRTVSKTAKVSKK